MCARCTSQPEVDGPRCVPSESGDDVCCPQLGYLGDTWKGTPEGGRQTTSAAFFPRATILLACYWQYTGDIQYFLSSSGVHTLLTGLCATAYYTGIRILNESRVAVKLPFAASVYLYKPTIQGNISPSVHGLRQTQHGSIDIFKCNIIRYLCDRLLYD